MISRNHGVTPVCVLKTSDEYTIKHAQWLAAQMPWIVCLSDVPVPGVETIRLRYDWPGWWSKMELFRPDLKGDLLYFDIDTVITGDISALFNVGKTTMLSDFYKPHMPASGLMYIAQQDKAIAWHHWMKKPEANMRQCRTREHWGDQGFLRKHLPHQRWDDVLPGQIVSYKVHCQRGLPATAKVVCFHGQPRPWDVKKHWIPPYGGKLQANT
ncbi:hypothetical protein G8770_03570 [Aestuariicella hydrocarbonica]|uniref:Uncharacterized protein n=1 Tax=Pseudomaricurvus hydrocarbonicus TaxID=1470433 RepID=A0A9E5JSR3_9GAMM|nr:hypothetical protein [Aestuariicella hydrocarbonica]NHO64624.1 hypothetical protein [Aestuariicella hydrocarbonica]